MQLRPLDQGGALSATYGTPWQLCQRVLVRLCARCEENNLISVMGNCGAAVLKFHSVRGLSIKRCVLKRLVEEKLEKLTRKCEGGETGASVWPLDTD